MERAAAAARQFVAEFSANPFGRGRLLSLLGSSNLGKTMLARCILGELRCGRWARIDSVPTSMHQGTLRYADWGFFDWRNLSRKFKAGEWDMLEVVQSKTLAVLDDIGADHDPSSLGASKVDELLRGRGRKWTIVTANLTLAEIHRSLDARIAGLMVRDGNVVVELTGKDYFTRRPAP